MEDSRYRGEKFKAVYGEFKGWRYPICGRIVRKVGSGQFFATPHSAADQWGTSPFCPPVSAPDKDRNRIVYSLLPLGAERRILSITQCATKGDFFSTDDRWIVSSIRPSVLRAPQSACASPRDRRLIDRGGSSYHFIQIGALGSSFVHDRGNRMCPLGQILRR